MSRKTTLNSITLAVGTAFVAGIATAPAVQADVNPFAATTLSSGYMVAEKGSEGNCGANKAKQATEAECGASKAEPKPIKEAKCGEAKCGENK